MQHLASGVSANYYTRLPVIISLLILTHTYIQAMALKMHTPGRFNNYSVHILYRILLTATSVVSVMEIGHIVPRAGLKPTSL